jgi:phosphoglycerate dehydrogenase-like enzyme
MVILVPAATLDELRPRAREIAPDVRLVPYEEEATVPVADAEQAVAVFRWVAGKRYEKLVLDGSGVRWLHTASAGVDHVLTPALRDRGGFTLTDSGPAFAVSIGEYVLSWMLFVSHRLDEVRECHRTREWRWVVEQEELYGQTVGVIGLGPVGQGIAERCKAFGMRTLGYRRTGAPAPHVDEVRIGPDGLRSLLAESDWIVLAAALTDETRALLGREEIALLKPTARVINIARGAIIDEAALTEALRTGRIAGAVLDVFVQEPLPPDSPLWDLPNVYVSPHTSPWTTGLRRRQLELFLANLERFVRGEALTGVVDQQRGY